MNQFGAIIQGRREAMELTLGGLSAAMGGTPGASFLSKIESGRVRPSRDVAIKLADTLTVPREAVLNAVGYTSPEQEKQAIEALRKILHEQVVVSQAIPVWDVETGRITGRTQAKLVREKDPSYGIVDMVDEENLPYVGEVLFTTGRRPRVEQGSVQRNLASGRLRAIKWNGNPQPGYGLVGAILRIVIEMDFEHDRR